MHDRCAWVIKQLPLYLDGELSGELATGVSRHLDRCAECRAALALEAESVALAVAALVGAEPDDDSGPAWREPDELPDHRLGGAKRDRSQSLVPLHGFARGRRGISLAWVVSFAAVAAALLVSAATFWVAPPQAAPRPGDSGPANVAVARPEPTSTEPRTPRLIAQDADTVPRSTADTAVPSRKQLPPASGSEPVIAARGTIVESTTALPLEMVLGDMNADGELTLADLRLFLHSLDVGFDAVPCAAAGDFDGDDQLTPADSVLASRSLGLHGGTPAPRLFTEIAANGPLDCQVVACP
ncbi:MAG: zf-HC2 domain-containing protein [Planctomycetota bacterium]